MDTFQTREGLEVLVICLEGGDIKAYQAMCPHQEFGLVEGEFDGSTLTCKAHLWQFDCHSGQGINPGDCHLAEYPVKVEGEDIFVDTDGVEPFKSHT